MNRLSPLQTYCLARMNIIRWQLGRENQDPAPTFMVCYDGNAYTPELASLLAKILTALKWPLDAVQQIAIPNQTSVLPNLFEGNRISIWFGLEGAYQRGLITQLKMEVLTQAASTVVICPGLLEIQKNPNLKREVWTALKPFILHR